MKHYQENLILGTSGRGLTDITREVQAVVTRAQVRVGLCVVFCTHTSASLLIQENADPAVGRDLFDWLARIAPDGDARYRHDAEGPDDMAAHLRTAITRTSEHIPITDGRLVLGTWQGIYLAEHRTASHQRHLVVHVTGTETQA